MFRKLIANGIFQVWDRSEYFIIGHENLESQGTVRELEN